MNKKSPALAVQRDREVPAADPHEHTGAEAADAVLANLRERRERPLVTVDAVYPERNWVEFTFYDRTGSGMEYEFHCCGFADGHHWIKQLAPKTWVTKEHIEVFAILLLQQFDDDGKVRRAAGASQR